MLGYSDGCEAYLDITNYAFIAVKCGNLEIRDHSKMLKGSHPELPEFSNGCTKKIWQKGVKEETCQDCGLSNKAVTGVCLFFFSLISTILVTSTPIFNLYTHNRPARINRYNYIFNAAESVE